MSKQFASVADLEEKTTTFEQLSAHGWAYTAEGDPNTGVVITDEGVLIVDALATPVMARRLIAEIRKVTDKPIRYVVLSHYHAVRVLGASAYKAEGMEQIIASQGTYDLIVERGEQDMASEHQRFPRLFQAFETVPGLTWPTLTFTDKMTLFMGGVRIEIMHLGAGHTKGDTVVWLPDEKLLFSGDLVEAESACYTGDAHLAAWPATLDQLRALDADALVPGRGPALIGKDAIAAGLAYTTDFVTTLFRCGQEAVAEKMSLKDAMTHTRKAMDPRFGHVFIYEHCLPFDVSRAYDEAAGIAHPRIWTAERDKEMWAALQD